MVACVCVSQKYITFCGKWPFLACESRKMSTFCICLSVCLSPSALPSRCEMYLMYEDGSSAAFEPYLKGAVGSNYGRKTLEEAFGNQPGYNHNLSLLNAMSTPSVILGQISSLAASWHWCCGVHHHFATSPPGSRHPSPLPNAMPAN